MIADGKNTLLKEFGKNGDILQLWQECYEQFKEQPNDLVRDLRGGSIDEQCQAIFGYLLDNVTYQEDASGFQWIKSPARLLSDHVGDCKSFTMFIASCLHCLGVKHIVRFVNFDGGTQYTHVYPVAIDENGYEIILDACEKDRQGYPVYDYARPFKKKKDFIYE